MRAEQEGRQLLFALGLCAKAGKLICGTPMICEALRGKARPQLVLTAADNSPNTAKRLRDKCAFYRVELFQTALSGESLAHAVGKTGHVAALAVTDANLAIMVRNNLSPHSANNTEQDDT